MALDSKAAFQERALVVGLSQANLASLSAVDVETYASFAYCTAYQPGQGDETPFVNFLTRTFGGAPDAGTLAAVCWLFFEAHAMALEDLRAKTDRTESSEARTLPLAEEVERVRQIKKSFGRTHIHVCNSAISCTHRQSLSAARR